MYAIVDIETTGGYAEKHRITEIAIFFHDGEKRLDHFQSLVNPEMPIPDYITGLTGITNEMVAEAPLFSEIASEVYKLLEGKIFIAHNVHFDYSFVKNEFSLAGFEFNSRKLCTVQLSRKLIPGLRSYSLGNLCESMGIPVKDRHRAAGDAEATAILFHHLLKRDSNSLITTLLKRSNKETKLPGNLPKEDFFNLPNEPGVYYFLDQNNTVIYVGKAIDIKKRIEGHFSGISGTWSNSNIRTQIHGISYELLGNELISLLFENAEILRIWPKYNKAQKVFSSKWGIYQYQDQNGYQRLSINKVKKSHSPLVSLPSHAEIWQLLNSRVEEFDLCPKLSGIQNTDGQCYHYEENKCDGACIGEVTEKEYNQRVWDAVKTFHTGELNIVITGKGRSEDEIGFVLMEEGQYKGFGFFDDDNPIESLDELRDFLQPAKDNHYSKQVIFAFLNKEGYKSYLIENNTLIENDFTDNLAN